MLGSLNIQIRIRSIRSFATAICSVKTSPFSRVSMHSTLGYEPRAPFGLKFHGSLALICVKIAQLIAE